MLQHILRSKQNLRVGVFVNDFADHNIDARVLERSAPEKILDMSGGCMCCPSSSDVFEQSMWSVLKEDSEIDYMVCLESAQLHPRIALRDIVQRRRS
jgi:G3E family GTPase